MLQATLTAQATPLRGHRPEARSAPVGVEPQAGSKIDEALAETFPASDPPAWMPGLARPAPIDEDEKTEGVIEVSRPPNDTPARKLASLIGAMGLSLIVPIVVLAVGLPVVLGVRGLLELGQWLVALVR